MFDTDKAFGPILTANSTIMAGILILLAIGATSGKEATVYIILADIPSTFLVAVVFVPFTVSSYFILAYTLPKNTEKKSAKMFEYSLTFLLAGMVYLTVMLIVLAVSSISVL